MSHFTVLVPANDMKDLEAKLQPFHEYECTGVKDQYVTFVEADMEEVKADHEKYGNQQSVEEFMDDWYGYVLEGDKWGRWTNPNKKWDWWVVGGRWSGLLQIKETDIGINGEGGLFSPVNTEPTKADATIAKYVRWQQMRNEQRDSAIAKHATYHEIMSDSSLTDSEREQKLIDTAGLWLDDELDRLSAEAYGEKHYNKAPVFAFIDMEGKWNQRGEMHWFAIVSNEQPDYDLTFWEFVESLPPTQWIWIVDCHI